MSCWKCGRLAVWWAHNIQARDYGYYCDDHVPPLHSDGWVREKA